MLRVFETNSFNKGFPGSETLSRKKRSFYKLMLNVTIFYIIFDCFYILRVKKMITPDFIPQNTIMEVNFEAEREHKG